MTLLLTAGLACVIAAIIGGGLKAWNIEIPTLKSVRRQVVLALFGILLIAAAGILKLSETSQGGKNANSSNIQLENDAAVREFFLGTWRVDLSVGTTVSDHNVIRYTANGRFDGTDSQVNSGGGRNLQLAGKWQVTKISNNVFQLDEQNDDGMPDWSGQFRIIDHNHIHNISKNYDEERVE